MSDPDEKLPRHVAVIMDGNGRWARRRGLPRTEGHKAGAQTARLVARECIERGIPYLTLYAFSTENWARPRAEVRFLMGQLRRFLVERRREMVDQGIRLHAIGALEELPRGVQRELQKSRDATAGGDRLTLTLALNYGARREIVHAARSIAQKVRTGEMLPDDVNEQALAAELYTAGLPDPDLLIRTAGEMRLSNFLLFQLSYAELYVTETLWPDFDGQDMDAALRAYAQRERRFGRGPGGRPPGADAEKGG
jgi:undecaprenyl diphosphate synthase